RLRMPISRAGTPVRASRPRANDERPRAKLSQAAGCVRGGAVGSSIPTGYTPSGGRERHMSHTIKERLRGVRVGEPASAGGLEVFALHWEPPAGGPAYRPLGGAVAEGSFEVTEVSAAGSVPTLKVVNKGPRPVFLMAGEHLAGGKQNRVLNASILVAGQAELPIPVSCVERGRWG